jgi:hypothetical protein
MRLPLLVLAFLLVTPAGCGEDPPPSAAAPTVRRGGKADDGNQVVGPPDGGNQDVGLSDGGNQDVGPSDGSNQDVGLPDGGNQDVGPSDGGNQDGGSGTSAWQRDWQAFPAVIEKQGVQRLWAISDVHGDRDRLVALLGAAGLTTSSATDPEWQGGSDTLVVNGDSIDKGPQSVEVLDYWMTLIPRAQAAGGEVAVLMGNHEVEFLGDPSTSKAAAMVAELGQESPGQFADTADPHGEFLHQRPIAALIDGWFFAHAGNPQGMSIDQIAARFIALVDAGSWQDDFFLAADSLIEGRSWWSTAADPVGLVDGYLAALPASHIVFGHHPTTFASPPSGNIEMRYQGRLTLIDVGMSRAVNYSQGKLLRVDAPGTAAEQASMVTETGAVVPLDLTR